MNKLTTGKFKQTVFIGLAIFAGSACSSKVDSAKQAAAPGRAATKPELELAREAVQKAPNFENYTRLGIAQFNGGDAAGALPTFESAAQLNPYSALAHNNLCTTYNSLKKWSAAMEACKKALTIDPAMQLAKNNLAAATAGQKKAADDLAALEKKAAGGSDNDALLALGLMYYERADYARAISTWKRISKGGKNWALAQNNIASAGILSRDFGVAKQALENALEAEPGNVLFKNNKDWLARAQKEAEGK